MQREMEAPEAIFRFITPCFAIRVSPINRQSIARACVYLPPYILGNCDVLAEQLSVIMPASCTMLRVFYSKVSKAPGCHALEVATKEIFKEARYTKNLGIHVVIDRPQLFLVAWMN